MERKLKENSEGVQSFVAFNICMLILLRLYLHFVHLEN